MIDKSTYIIYLRPEVAGEQWSFIHRFFHPGILEHDKKCAFVAFSLHTSHHTFLSATVREFPTGKNKTIHIPYSMVVAMVEVPFRKNQKNLLKFLSSDKEIF